MASPGPLLTRAVHEALLAARAGGNALLECSLDLERSRTTVAVGPQTWRCSGHEFPFATLCRERTIYHWTGRAFEPVSRFSRSLVKLVPTQWGAPTFEIDGIQMLPTARVSPWEDAAHKVELIQPGGKSILDTCGGLGYFAAHCLRGQARHVQSYEKNPDVIWLRGLNPWSPDSAWSSGSTAALTLIHGDIAECIASLASASFDAVLHDPPRFAIAGELYSQLFYGELARVLRPGGRLFHYTGAPNRLSHGRDLAGEVARRLRQAGFTATPSGDGVLAVRTGRG